MLYARPARTHTREASATSHAGITIVLCTEELSRRTATRSIGPTMVWSCNGPRGGDGARRPCETSKPPCALRGWATRAVYYLGSEERPGKRTTASRTTTAPIGEPAKCRLVVEHVQCTLDSHMPCRFLATQTAGSAHSSVRRHCSRQSVVVCEDRAASLLSSRSQRCQRGLVNARILTDVDLSHCGGRVTDPVTQVTKSDNSNSAG